MRGRLGYRLWLPFALTVALWIALVFATAALISDTWADLAGLLYLLASPLVYRLFAWSVRGDREPVAADRERAGTPGE